MDLTKYMANKNEKPLDNIAVNGGFTSIFRTIGCIGDSLASGELESFEMGRKGYYDYFDDSWGQFIARDAGCKVYNFSRGGMTAKEYIETYADEKGFFDIEKRCQAYIIALGVNDVTDILDGKFEFGTVEDIKVDNYALNKPTFAGWYGAIISKYKEIQPHAKFFLMTMPNIGDEKNALMQMKNMLNCFMILQNSFQTVLCWIFINMRLFTMIKCLKRHFIQEDI